MVHGSFVLFLLFLAHCCGAQESGIVKKHNKYGYKENGHWVVRPRYDSVTTFSENRIAVMKNGKWGFINERGKKITRRHFAEVTSFQGGLAAVRKKANGRWYLLNRDGTFFEDHVYDTIVLIDSIAIAKAANWHTGDTLAAIWKFPGQIIHSGIDSTALHGQQLVLMYERPQFHPQRKTYRDVAQIISTRGTAITPVIFIEDSFLHAQTVVTEVLYGEQAVLTRSAELSPWYSQIVAIDAQHYAVKKSWRTGVMDTSFHVRVPLLYTAVEDAGPNFIVRAQAGEFLIDTGGHLLTTAYHSITHLKDGVCIAQKDALHTVCVFITADGKVAGETYGHIYAPSEGIFRVVSADFRRYSYVDSSGRRITPWYDRSVVFIPEERGGEETSPGDFLNGILRGIAAITTFGLTEFLHMFGPPPNPASPAVAPPHTNFPGYLNGYDYFYGTDVHRGYAFTSISRKEKASAGHPAEEAVYLGVIDSTGRQVVPNDCRYIFPADTFFIVQKKSGFGLMTRSGKTLLAPVYGMITPLGNNYFEVKQNAAAGNNHALYRVENSEGKFLSAFRYYNIADGGDSMFIVQPDVLHYGFMNAQGKVVVPMIYERVTPYQNGRAKVTTDWSQPEMIELDTQGKRVR